MITRTFTVIDSCDNSATCDQVFNIDDTTDPTITCPAGTTYEACTTADIAALTTLPFTTAQATITLAQLTAAGGTAGDNCAVKEINYVDSQSGTCPIVITRTFTVIDSCDNSATCDQVFNIDDTTDPTITCPAGTTYEACTTADIAALTTLPFTTAQGNNNTGTTNRCRRDRWRQLRRKRD